MRRIKKANIQYISLIPAGANRLPVIYKSEHQQAEFIPILKEVNNFDELGELIAVVYAPEQRDAHGDVASAQVIKEMAYDFMKNNGQLDMKHNGKALSKSQGHIAETFIIQPGDPRFENFKDASGTVVDVEGGWATVIKIDDPELRHAYRSGAWNGVSMAGPALLEVEKGTDPDPETKNLWSLVKQLISGSTSPTPYGDDSMTPEQVKVELDAREAALLEKIEKMLAPKKEKEPTVSINSLADLRKHRLLARKEEILKGVSLENKESVEEAEIELEEIEKSLKGEDTASSEIARLQKRIDRLSKRSNTDDSDTANLLVTDADFKKEDADAAREMIEFINGK